MHKALNKETLRKYGHIVPSDMDTLKRDVTNRRMRKTARTVV
jgi:hypothetical protein